MCLLPIPDPSLNLMTSVKPILSRSPTITLPTQWVILRVHATPPLTWVCQADGCCLCKCFHHLTFITTRCPDFPGLSPPSHPGFLARFLLSWQSSVERCFRPCSILPSFLYLPTPQKKASSHTVLSTMEFGEIHIHKCWLIISSQIHNRHFISNTLNSWVFSHRPAPPIAFAALGNGTVKYPVAQAKDLDVSYGLTYFCLTRNI